jgi:hypothetical protein
MSEALDLYPHHVWLICATGVGSQPSVLAGTQVWNFFSVDCTEICSPQTEPSATESIDKFVENNSNYLKHLNDGNFGRPCIMLTSQIS